MAGKSSQGKRKMSAISEASGSGSADLRNNSIQIGDESQPIIMSARRKNDPESNCCSPCCGSLQHVNCQDNPVSKYCIDFWKPQTLKKKLPIITWAPKYRVKHLVGDLVAGLTVGLTVIPQGLAYARIAELPPQYGLYASFMGVFIYMFFGTSKDITLGPTAIMSLMVAEFASTRAPTEDDHAIYAIVLTLGVGLIQIAMGLLNLGFVVQFISFPVISGFTSAAAIIIAFSQVKKLLGLKNIPRDFLPEVKATFENIGKTNTADLGLGLCCIIVLFGMKFLKDFVDPRMKKEQNKVKKAALKIVWLICTARNAVVVVITAGIAAVLVDNYGINKLSITGNITEGIPTPAAPVFYLNVTTPSVGKTGYIIQDIGEGFVVVALIGLLESIAIAKAFARKNEYQVDSNQELIALGVANTVSCFFHSYPVTGSFSRTAINSQSGVRTPAGGLWTGLLIIVALAVLTPYFYYIPEAALAAVIICAVLQMVEYEVIPRLWRVKKLDLAALFITFLACLFGSIEIGILTGVGFSILILIYPMARPELNIRKESYVSRGGGKLSGGEEDDSEEQLKEAVVIEPNQGLKFPAIEYIKDKVMKYGVFETPTKAVILNALHLSGTDFTVVMGIQQLAEYFQKHNLQFVVATCNRELITILDNAEIRQLRLAATVPDAIEMVFGQYEEHHELSESSSTVNDSADEGSQFQTDRGVDNPNYQDDQTVEVEVHNSARVTPRE